MSNKTEPIIKSEVLKAISNDKSLELFAIIGSTEEMTYNDHYPNCINMTRKQYYSRIGKMINAQLIKRRRGKYELTSFGKIIYEIVLNIRIAIDNLYRLNAIDNLNSSITMPIGERKEILNLMLGNDLKHFEKYLTRYK